MADNIQQSGRTPSIKDISAFVAAKVGQQIIQYLEALWMLHLTINGMALNQSQVSNWVIHPSPVSPRSTPKEPCQANKRTSQGVVQGVDI